MHAINNGTFCRAVSYARTISLKSTTGVNVVKRFITDDRAKLVFFPCKFFQVSLMLASKVGFSLGGPPLACLTPRLGCWVVFHKYCLPTSYNHDWARIPYQNDKVF
jgi:hypothetical protein